MTRIEQLIADTRQQAEEIRAEGLYEYSAKDIAENFEALASELEQLYKASKEA